MAGIKKEGEEMEKNGTYLLRNENIAAVGSNSNSETLSAPNNTFLIHEAAGDGTREPSRCFGLEGTHHGGFPKMHLQQIMICRRCGFSSFL
jgi:hypothetical protein